MTPPLIRWASPDQIPPRRRLAIDPQTLDEARRIVDDVAARGEPALRFHAERLGDLAPGAPLVHTPADLRAALDRLPRDQRRLLERTAERIRAFALAQRDCLRDLTLPIPGGQAGHHCIPVDAAGCYAPGGRFPLPSSVLMTAVTARAAGVPTVWLASPRPVEATLAAAAITGADGLLAAGGAQAIAALAFGVAGPAADVVVGPGNRWVTAAKQIVSATVGIDMLAGPSELVILADGSADPALIAADLLAQAEHDPDALPILVSTSRRVVEAVNGRLVEQLETLPTRRTALAALTNGFAILAPDIPAAIDLCNRLAPEHLQVMVRDPAAAAHIRHCGALFLGPDAAEVLGDYGAGPNHVLPTGGTAHHRAGLSVFTFLRLRTFLRIDDPRAAALIAHDAVSLARMEGLEAHARAAALRAVGDRPHGQGRT